MWPGCYSAAMNVTSVLDQWDGMLDAADTVLMVVNQAGHTGYAS